MNIKIFVFNPFYENTIILSSRKKNCFIFDPGCYENFEFDELNNYIETEGLRVKAVINTHCHIDHVLGNYLLKNRYEVPLKIPVNEKKMYEAVPVYAPQWGITNYVHTEVDEYLKEGVKLRLDEVSFKLIEVPGHSPGHFMFHSEDEEMMIGGDVLFRESIGRTDLPGGDHQVLLNNIREKVYALPDEVTVYPGHGPETTIGHEKRNNPFVKA